LGEEYRKFKDETNIVFSKKLANWNNMGYEYFIEDKIIYVKHIFGNYPFEIINNKLLYNSKDDEYYAIFSDEDFKDKYKDIFIGKWTVLGTTGWDGIPIWLFSSNGTINQYSNTYNNINLKFKASSAILRIFHSGSEEKVLSEYYYIQQDDKIILKQSRAKDFILVKD
jgi:hypothetical protein